MEATTPPSRSKRSRARNESDEDEVSRSSRRRASKVKSYAEESDDEDNITVDPGPGALLHELESEVSEEESGAEIRCICGATEEDDDDAERQYVQCDRCGVWQHTDCLGMSASEAKRKNVMCNQCSPYGAVGASVSPAEQPGLPVRTTSNNTNSKAGRSKGKILDVLSYYPRNNDFSVKRSTKRVTFSPDAKPASDSEDADQDAYTPSNEEASDGDEEEDYPNDFDEDDGPTLFLSPSPAPSNASNEIKLAKRPRPPGVTDLGERIVQKWIAGGYAAEIDAENNAVEWGSDVSEIDIPDMSEGVDLLAKLAEQDRLIFSMKKRLEKRRERIKSLKQQVKDLERENWMLKGVE